jgi:hypothetical protein
LQIRLERLPVKQALDSLKAAESATWVPYGMLRDPVIPVELSPAARRAKKGEEALQQSAADETGQEAAQQGAEAKSKHMATPAAAVGSTIARLTSGATLARLHSADAAGAEEGAGGEHMPGGDDDPAGAPRGRAPRLWELDPSQNREGLEDLRLDDARAVRAPAWQRVTALRKLQALARGKGSSDPEALAAVLRLFQDPDGMVRAEALRVLRALAPRREREEDGDAADRGPLRAAIAMAQDKVADVRHEVCVTLAALADPGDPPPPRLFAVARTVSSCTVPLPPPRALPAVQAHNRVPHPVRTGRDARCHSVRTGRDAPAASTARHTPGKLPSREMTGTSRDVEIMQRDKEVRPRPRACVRRAPDPALPARVRHAPDTAIGGGRAHAAARRRSGLRAQVGGGGAGHC